MVFNERTLPNALRHEHATKAGVWGVVRVLEGSLRLRFEDGREQRLDAGNAAVVRPQEVHWVELVEKVQVQIEFYDRSPAPE